jgi:alpha-tubulin suppressor-like RCC1 family protein
MKRFLIILVNACLCAYLLVGGTLPVQASQLHDPVIFTIYLPLVIKSIAAPSATTGAAANISGTSATLNGSVNANNGSATVTFQYGLTTSYGSSATATQSPVSGTANTPVSAAISGLTPNTPYHFRVVAVNTGGTTNGSDATFTTSPIIATSISAGEYVTCALTNTGGVKCWGNNSDGELGDGTTTERHTPIDVKGLNSVVVTAVSNGYKHTCALTSLGGVKCWGFNFDGELGNGKNTNSLTPVDVSGLTSNVAGISANGFHTCAVTNAGAVWCWGYNGYGELGNATTTSSNTPVKVKSGTGTDYLSGVSVVKAGGYHTCALLSSGGVVCWGKNDTGQIGDGTFINRLTAVNSGLTSGVGALSAGDAHTCALISSSHGLKCWGYNAYGQLGDGSTTNHNTPETISALSSGVDSLNAGARHTCVLMQTGSVKCFGYNAYGELGNGSTTSSSTPVNVMNGGVPLSAVSIVKAGYFHSCALLTSGGVRCWGDNGFGELGNNSTNNSNTPVSVVGFP